MIQNQKTCPDCKGTGKVIREKCKDCYGTGYIATRKNIKVVIPAGIDEGQSIRMRDLGEPGVNGGEIVFQGSTASVKKMLCELFKYSAGDFEGYQTESNDTAAGMLKRIRENGAKYPRSAAKIAFMVRRFDEDGFTSYWL